MSVIRLTWLIFTAVVLVCRFCPDATAADCWNGSPAAFDFGPLTPGQKSVTSTKLAFTCNNYDTQTEYVRACLKVMANDPLVMAQNSPDSAPLYFSIYSLYDLHYPLSQNTDVYAQINLELAAGQNNIEHDIPLIGKINSGQTTMRAGAYYDYATMVQITYASAASAQSLPSCSGLSGTTLTDQISATATVKSGCSILNAEDMAFGNKSPAQNSQLQASAVATIAVQCPTGTSYSVSLGSGLHPEGNKRMLCHAGECVSYTLYQDAAHSVEWSDSHPLKNYSSDGQAQNMVVYGQVPPQQWPSSGVYTDTVIINVTY